jgi:cytoskeleton protein RodZ
MNDAVMVDSPAPQLSAGTLLRRAREAAGLHVAAVAVALKVPVRKLEALEEDRFQDLGDPVFIRGLASSVCRTLKIDPQPVLERLPQTGVPRLVRDTDGLNAPFRAPSDAPAPSWIDAVRQPVPLTVLALVIGMVVIYFLPARQLEEMATPAAVVPAPATSVAPEPAPVASQPAPAPAALASVTPPAVIEAPAPRIAPAPVVAAPASAPAPANGIVVFRAKNDSWVEVVDAKGVVALRKLMAPGESVGASGALPLQVTVGRVDMTEVEVRGKKFDMRPVSKDNVARFEVK